MDISGTLFGQIVDIVARATRFMRPYQGRVVSVDDLEVRGRVQCAVEELGWFTQAEAPWCEPLYRGGSLCVPAVGDYVKVEFLAGNGARPVWDGLVGEVSGQGPEEHDGPKKRVLYSRDGKSIVHDEIAMVLEITGFENTIIDDGTNGAARMNDTIGIDAVTDPVNVPMLIAVCSIFGMTLVPPIVGKITGGSTTVKIGG